MQKFYEVHCMGGHVGLNKHCDLVFAVKATSAKEAAALVKAGPRVKKNTKHAISSVQKVSYERFVAIRAANSADPYWRCHNVQQQRATVLDLDERTIVDKDPYANIRRSLPDPGKKIFFHKTMVRSNPKNFARCQDEAMKFSYIAF